MNRFRLVAAVVVCLAGHFSSAPAAAQLVPAAGSPARPRTNMATWYEVDARWPQRPADAAWGAISGLAVDRQDRVWIFTRAKPPVQVYDAAGKFLFAWGGDFVDTAHSLRIDDQGNVWLTDVRAHVVRKCSADGKLLLTLGVVGQPGDDARHFNKPTDTAITPAGDLFVADGYGNDRIVHFDREGKFVKAWGKTGTGPGEFSLPHAIVVDSKGRLYVADRNNARVQVFEQDGRFIAEWRNIMVPWGITVGKDDELLVCGSSPLPWRSTDTHLSCPPKDQLLVWMDAGGRVRRLWTLPFVPQDPKPGELNWLHNAAADSKGNLYVTDILGKRAQKLLRRD